MCEFSFQSNLIRAEQKATTDNYGMCAMLERGRQGELLLEEQCECWAVYSEINISGTVFSLSCSLHCIIGPFHSNFYDSFVHWDKLYICLFSLSCCKICIFLPYCVYRIQYVLSLSDRSVTVESNLNEQTSFSCLNQKENLIPLSEHHTLDLKMWPLFSFCIRTCHYKEKSGSNLCHK